jgi:hypothetical protein
MLLYKIVITTCLIFVILEREEREGLKFLEREGEKSRDLCSPGEEVSHLPLLVLVFPLGL